jgi:hypothetical protein
MAAPRGSRPRGHERAVATSERVYQSLLRGYPRELREEYGDEMARCFRDLCREALEDGGGLGLAALWARTLPEWLCTALKERSTLMASNAYRAAAGVRLVTAIILLLFSVLMQITDEMNWSVFDFAVAAASSSVRVSPISWSRGRRERWRTDWRSALRWRRHSSWSG